MSLPVTSLTYYLTEACNLRCTYCYVDKNPKRSSSEVGKATIDFLIRESRDETDLHLRFFGGEPMLEMQQIEHLVHFGRERANAAGKRIRFDMISNSTLATPEVVAKLAELGVEVMSSVDGNRRTMEQNRPFFVLRENFDDFDQKLRNLAASGVGTIARMTISPACTDFVANLEHILELGYGAIIVATANNASWRQEALDQIYDELATFYIDSARQGRLLPLVITNQLLVSRHEMENGTYEPPRDGFCSAGKEMLGVDVHGDLYPCHRFVQMGEEFRLGSVQEGIEEEKRKPFATVTTDTLHHEKCRTCHALPYCPGSCMAANLPESDDLFYPETRHCFDLRAHVKAVERIYETLMKERCQPLIDFLEKEWQKSRRKLLMSVLAEAAAESAKQPTLQG